MKFNKNKKGVISEGTFVVGAILILLSVLVAGANYFGVGSVDFSDLSSGNGTALSITRWTGDVTIVSPPQILNPDAEEGTPLEVQYSVYNHGRERSVCGFVELLADENVFDSRYFCLSNTNRYGRDATKLVENITIEGLEEGIHKLKVRSALQTKGYVDVDDEYLYKYRSCPDGDKYNTSSGKTRYYEPDMNNAFRPFIKYMPCEIKKGWPTYRNEYAYDNGSLINYALTVDSGFNYEEIERTIYIAERGAFASFRAEEQRLQEIAFWQTQIEQLEKELAENADLTLGERILLEAELDEYRQNLEALENGADSAMEVDDVSGTIGKYKWYIIAGIMALAGFALMAFAGIYWYFRKK